MLETAFIPKIIRFGMYKTIKLFRPDGKMLELFFIVCPNAHYFPVAIYKISWLVFYKAKDGASPLSY